MVGEEETQLPVLPAFRFCFIKIIFNLYYWLQGGEIIFIEYESHVLTIGLAVLHMAM